MTEPPSGRLANASGRLLEDMIRTTLTAKGLVVVPYRAYHAHPDSRIVMRSQCGVNARGSHRPAA